MSARRNPLALAPWIGALVGTILLWQSGLTSYVLTDYQTEALPAMNHLVSGEFEAYLRALPGYGGALLMESPFAVFGGLLGPDNVTGVWRSLALPGIGVLFAGGVVLGRTVASHIGGNAGATWGALTAASFSGSPIAVLALQLGHPEELLVSGLTLGGVALGIRGRPGLAGLVVGLAAAGKPWALIAVPVVVLAADSRPAAIRTAGAIVVAGVVLSLPMMIAHNGTGSAASASSAATGIFKPSSVFWFLGDPNPDWEAVRSATTRMLQQPDSTKEFWAQRLEPGVVGQISHPLIVLFAAAMSAAFLACRRSVDERREDLFLLLATVCWWRCLLDTWNVHYYALGAVLALAAWQARRGRPPVLAFVVTASILVTFRVLNWSATSPDAQAALYLAWAVPLGVLMMWRSLAPQSAARAFQVALRPAAALFPTFVRAVSAPAARR